MRVTSRFTIVSCALALATGTAVGAAAQDSAKMTNPVKPTDASVAAGKKIFDSQCVACHGAEGKGDGKMASELNPKPADLTDATWKHGSSDGDIFVVIRDGAKGTGMKPFGGKMSANDIWNVVNYLRSIGPKLPPSH